MISWISNLPLRRLSGSVVSGYRPKEDNSSLAVFEPEPEPEKPRTPEQDAAETTMSQFLQRRSDAYQRRKRKSYTSNVPSLLKIVLEQEKRQQELQMDMRTKGPEDGFSDVCHDISPPAKKQPNDHVSDVDANEDPTDMIQELELIHFLLTELNQHKNKWAPVKELRGYLMMFYANLITFIRNRNEPINIRFSARHNKKSVEDKFDDKFLQVIDEYIKSNLFGLSTSGKDLFLTKETVSKFHEIEDKLSRAMETGLKSEILELLKMANSCLTLHQILDAVRRNHQYLVSLRLKTIGSVRDFLLEHPHDFAVIDENVCLVKGSALKPSKPSFENTPLASGPNKLGLKRSVSFAEPSTFTHKSEEKPHDNQLSGQPQSIRTAFSKKSKMIEQPVSADHIHGPHCDCEKLSMYKFVSSLTEVNLIQFNHKCLAASYLKVAQTFNRNSVLKENFSQTEITFDPKENI